MHIRIFVRRAIVIAALLLGGSTAGTQAEQLVDFHNVAFEQATGATSIPVGAVDFCRRNPHDCAMTLNVVDDVHLTQQLWSQLLAVNSHFNTSIVPETDQQLYHVAEFWTYPHGFGDCEDIALAKRRQLIADGWPASTLLMTVARDRDGEGHALLMVRTDRGDLILDNQDSTVRDWRDSPYHFLKRQSQTSLAQWVGLEDPRPQIILAKY